MYLYLSSEKETKPSKKKTSTSVSRDDTHLPSSDVLMSRCVGANIKKDGEDPELLSDNEYPEWLWSLMDKPASEFGPEQRTLWRRFNKAQARQRNFERSEMNN